MDPNDEIYNDHPYSSPDEDSERDDDIVELDFDEYCGQQTHSIPPALPEETTAELSSCSWCSCKKCTYISDTESLCCNQQPEIKEMLPSLGDCVTDMPFVKNILTDDEGLDYSRYVMASMIKNDIEREKYLNKPFTNSLKRNLAYRNFLVFLHKGTPLGRHNRVVLPRCVVQCIREKYPDEDNNYTGFIDVAQVESE